MRESALGRVRSLTRAAVAAGLALTAVFTLIAAGSTHAKKLVVVRVRGRTRVTRKAHVTAPVPPLVSASSSAASAEGDGGSAPPPAAAQPPPAPAPAAVTPVVVSGGS